METGSCSFLIRLHIGDEMTEPSGTADITKTSDSTFGSVKCDHNDMCTEEDD